MNSKAIAVIMAVAMAAVGFSVVIADDAAADPIPLDRVTVEVGDSDASTVIGINEGNYTGYKYNFKGYICLEFTLLWGVLITAAMATAWHLLHWLIHKIPSRPLFWLSAVFRVVLTMDFLFNFGYLLKTGKHFSLEKLALGLGKLFSLRRSFGGCI